MSGRAAKRARRAEGTPQTQEARRCGCYLQDREHTETDACRVQEQAFLRWWRKSWAG